MHQKYSTNVHYNSLKWGICPCSLIKSRPIACCSPSVEEDNFCIENVNSLPTTGRPLSGMQRTDRRLSLKSQTIYIKHNNVLLLSRPKPSRFPIAEAVRAASATHKPDIFTLLSPRVFWSTDFPVRTQWRRQWRRALVANRLQIRTPSTVSTSKPYPSQ